MTASLPVPHDADPDDPDGEAGAGRPVRPLTPKPPKTKTRPKAKSSPRPSVSTSPGEPPATVDADASAMGAPDADPGPPPPLPEDLLPRASEADGIYIPPRPPLPSPTSEDPAAAPDARPGAVAETPEGDVAADDDPAGTPDDTESAAPVPAAEPDVLESEEEPETVDPVVVHEASDPFAGSVTLDRDAESAAPALVLRGVVKSFGQTRAVDGIDLTVPAGTFYGLVGPNGAGKTTTLSLIAGLLTADKGSISVAGVDAAADRGGVKRLMGVLPDRLRTFDRLTGRQLLYYYGMLRGLPSATVESRITDLARAFDLSGALGRSVSDYSAGMVKKVMLAGALIHSPRLLVLDEPFEAVDPVSSAVILDILSAYVAHGGTVILSSHGMGFVERVCSRVAVMVSGQVLAEGTIDEVRGELTLEQRFIELAGGLSDAEGLEWLHTFSD